MSTDRRRLTFVLTDLVGSTRRWEIDPIGTARLIEDHERFVEAAVEREGGRLVRSMGEGDSTFSVFQDPVAALRTAADVVSSLPDGLEVRAAVHTGSAQSRDGDLYGSDVNRAARLRSIAHAGQIVVSSATAEFARAALAQGDLGLLDLGERRLRDLSRSERVYQLTGEGLRSSFPPLRWVDARRSNVAVPRSTFIGRTDDLSEVARSIDRSPITTLVGPGGSGKTRLAIETCVDLMGRFDGGIWFVDLAAQSAPGAVASAVADAAGAMVPVGIDPIASLIEKYSGASVLFVLDNCEHLIDAVGDVSDRLVSGHPEIRVLATSRLPMRIDGEAVHTVEPLPVEGIGGEPSEAVRLFVARVRAAGIEPGAGDEAAMHRICRRVDGLPLGIELAAARCRIMGFQELAARLDDDLSVARGHRGTDPRHLTMDSLIGWSYELLDENERRLLRRLAIFRGHFTLADVEGLEGTQTTSDETLRTLAELVDHSLVLVDESRESYRLLETIRSFGLGRLVAEGEIDAALADHRRWFLQMARAVRDLPARDQVPTLARLSAHDPDLVAAVEGAVASEDVDAALELVACLWKYWLVSGRIVQGDGYLETVLSLDGGDAAHRAWALIGRAHLGGGDLATRCAAAAAAFDIAERIGSDVLCGEASTALALTSDDANVAVAWARRALDFLGGGPDPTSTRVAKVALGVALSWTADPDAIAVLKEALAEAETAGDGFIMQRCNDLISQLSVDDEETLAHASRAGEVALRIGMEANVADCFLFAGHAASRLGKLEEARDRFERSVAAAADDYLAGRRWRNDAAIHLIDAARSLYGAGDRPTAELYLRRAQAHPGNHWDRRALEAIMARDDGDLPRAAALIAETLSEEPDTIADVAAVKRGLVRCAAGLAGMAGETDLADRWFAAVVAMPTHPALAARVRPYHESDERLVRGVRSEEAFASALESIEPPDLDTATDEAVTWLRSLC